MSGPHIRPKFVTAFAGRRDDYQVPLALAEAGRLERMITSGYATPTARRLARLLPGRARDAVLSRHAPGVPTDRVAAAWWTEVYEQCGRRLRLPPPLYRSWVDRALSEAAGRAAERAGADLLLYEPYAVEAFDHHYSGRTPRKVLFHFHPHPDFEAGILDADTRTSGFQFALPTPDGGGQRDPHAMAVRQVWRHADLILCASSVTRRSLIAAGASPDLCRVIPYGVATNPEPPPYTGGNRFRVLFVGSGIQRKGLHHLLSAWREASLSNGAELTLVCRSIDPAVVAEANKTPGCVLLEGVPRNQLRELFRRSDLFALPSLLEGFGQSYLEALAEGCPVLGTANTGVPDLGGEGDGVFSVPAGDAHAIAESLGQIASRTGDADLRMNAWRTACNHSWERFRGQLMAELS